jgi:hypothetical protein
MAGGANHIRGKLTYSSTNLMKLQPLHRPVRTPDRDKRGGGVVGWGWGRKRIEIFWKLKKIRTTYMI